MKIFSRTFVVLSLLLGVKCYSQVSWIVDNTHGNMGFSVKYMGIGDYEGKFKVYDGKVESKTENDFEDAQFNILFDMNAVSAVVEGHEEILKGEDFFDVKHFPFAFFRSTGMKSTATKGTYILTGNLSIRGITKEIKLTAIAAPAPIVNPYFNNTNYGLKISGQVKRSDFGIGTYDLMDIGELVLSDEVQIVSSLILVKSDHKIQMVSNLKNSVQEKGLEKYQGQYEYVKGSILSVSVEDERLYIQKDTNHRKQIFRLSENRFIYEFYDVEIEFSSSRNAEVEALTVIAGNQKTKAMKISDSPKNDILQGKQEKDPGSSTFLGKSWDALLKKSYADAVELCLAGLELSPDDLSLKINLAHAYLFSGDYEKAIKVYKENLNKKQFGTIPFQRLIQQDFVFFASRQYSKDLLNKTYIALGLKPVDAFKRIN